MFNLVYVNNVASVRYVVSQVQGLTDPRHNTQALGETWVRQGGFDTQRGET